MCATREHAGAVCARCDVCGHSTRDAARAERAHPIPSSPYGLHTTVSDHPAVDEMVNLRPAPASTIVTSPLTPLYTCTIEGGAGR